MRVRGSITGRLDQDGVVYDPSDVPAALSLLEENGEYGYDVGALPGLPFRVQRPDPPQPTAFALHPPRPLVLATLRSF